MERIIVAESTIPSTARNDFVHPEYCYMATDPLDSHQPRSPLMMNSTDTALIVIDMQEKLLPHISQAQIVTWNIGRLLAGADALGVKVGGTEQYPKGY